VRTAAAEEAIVLDGPIEDHDDSSSMEESVTWDTEVEIVCPYCGAVVTIGLDPGGGSEQTYVEDCQVCCQPWHVHLRYDRDGVALVEVDTAG
jgi:Cysteine-rich CPXCG